MVRYNFKLPRSFLALDLFRIYTDQLLRKKLMSKFIGACCQRLIVVDAFIQQSILEEMKVFKQTEKLFCYYLFNYKAKTLRHLWIGLKMIRSTFWFTISNWATASVGGDWHFGTTIVQSTASATTSNFLFLLFLLLLGWLLMNTGNKKNEHISHISHQCVLCSKSTTAAEHKECCE